MVSLVKENQRKSFALGKTDVRGQSIPSCLFIGNKKFLIN